MKKLLSIVLVITILFTVTSALPSVFAAESTVFRATETYSGHTSVQDNESNKYIEQQYDSNGQDPNGEGKFARLYATDAGCTITFTLTLEKAGNYDTVIRFRAHESTGVAEITVNGVSIGSLDGRSGVNNHAANGCYDAEYTEVPFLAGENTVTFTTAEKGVSGYGVNLFKFTLTPIDKTTMTGSEKPNSQSYYTTGKEGYSAFSGSMVPDDQHPDGSWAANYEYNDMYCFRVTDGSYFGYEIEVETEGSYQLQWIARGHSSSYGTFGVYINGIDEESLVKSGISTYYHETKMLTFDLGSVTMTEGTNTVYFVSEADDTIENNVFVSGEIVISDGSSLLTPDYITAGYLSTRVNETDSTAQDLRVVLVSDVSAFDQYDTVTVTLEFYLDQSKVVTHSRNIGEKNGFQLYRSVTAAGKKYVTEEGYAIYGMVITQIPQDAWSSLVITVSAENTILSQGSIDTSSLIR